MFGGFGVLFYLRHIRISKGFKAIDKFDNEKKAELSMGSSFSIDEDFEMNEKSFYLFKNTFARAVSKFLIFYTPVIKNLTFLLPHN